MIGLIILVGAIAGIGTRASQSHVDKTTAVGMAIGGWLALMLLGALMPPSAGLVLRWLWLGALYLFIELAHGGSKASGTWRCPERTMFNDPGTLVCLCGYENRETAAAESSYRCRKSSKHSLHRAPPRNVRGPAIASACLSPRGCRRRIFSAAAGAVQQL